VVSRLKILMVAPRFSPKSGGGGYVITKNLIKALEKRGHNIGVYTSDYEFDINEAYKDINQSGKHVWLMPFKTIKTIASLHITRPHLNWRAGVFTPDVDIIHMQGCRTWQNIEAYKQARKYNIPYIVEAHGFPIQGTWFYKLILKLFDIMFANKIVRNASLCIAESETGKKEYLRAGVKEEKIKIIPAPYDLSIFDDLPKRGEWRNRQNVPSGAKIIGFLGGLDKIKGLDFLTKTFANVCQEKDAVLVLAGTDMGFKKELEILIDELGIKDKVIFTGYISGRDKLEFLVDCDVCVFPSWAEQGLPFAALESIMCGVPIILTDGTGAAEDAGKIGIPYVIGFGDIEGLSKVIGWILDGTVKSNCVEVAQNYIRMNLSIAEKVKDYEIIYKEVVK
jgi:glycosyltransferase involved in cell wall biosynthesis